MSITIPGLDEFFDGIAPSIPSSVFGPLMAGLMITLLVVSAIVYLIAIARLVIQYIATWRMFRAAGERGWKCLIPFYGRYVQYRLVWSTTAFWVVLILTISAIVLYEIAIFMMFLSAGPWLETLFNSLQHGSLPGTMISMNPGTAVAVGIIWIVVGLIFIAIFVMNILFCYHLSKSYNHGTGYFFGLLFFYDLFYVVIGFDSGLKYTGNANARHAAKQGNGNSYQPVPTDEAIPYIADQAAPEAAPAVQEPGAPVQAETAENGLAATENPTVDAADPQNNTPAEP